MRRAAEPTAQPPAVRTPPPRRPRPPDDGPVAASVRAAVAAHPADPSAVLALTYAAQIDDANHIPADLADAIGVLHALAVEPVAQRALRRLVMRIARVTVTGDLGPKLLAALDALVLTPKSQGAGKEAKGGNGAEDELARLRRRRAARASG